MGIKQILQDSIVGKFIIYAALDMPNDSGDVQNTPGQSTELLSCDNIRWAAQIATTTAFRTCVMYCKHTAIDIRDANGYILQILYIEDSRGNICLSEDGRFPVMCTIKIPKPLKRPLASSRRN